MHSGFPSERRLTQVTAGTRLALTVAFTCNPNAAIKDFLNRALPDENTSREGSAPQVGVVGR